ncbi:hypothetical protein K461DRAFT_321136 [Myriangium duriaei CBS 260.36]|uniref:Archaemetzincin-2 n=1 Tax=Myriangium duriaei CBS 260.36 TaxID=1168546 RepID=A0A9P4J2G0_9PEZI|nr:hypothetical protein K461DRAFT_321136 [Myriangium duriaei CBS 260.36]
MPSCSHMELVYGPSEASKHAGYVLRDWAQLQAAKGNKTTGKITDSGAQSIASHRLLYPAPLVLPNDDLYIDPEYDPQTFGDWPKLVNAHFVPAKRRKMYLVPPPQTDSDVSFVDDWTHSTINKRSKPRMQPPSAADVCNYLEAFYGGLETKLLPASTLTWGSWDGDSEDIALQTQTEGIRIRVRTCKDRLLPKQLNLNDLLDVAIEILPEDALALIMLVDHDIYEDEDDDFVCGRAFGGSHVCVVSSARYQPLLDQAQSVNRSHSWPASHCKAFVERHCAQYIEGPKPKKPKIVGQAQNGHSSGPIDTNQTPLQAAIAALKTLKVSSPQYLSSLWLWRVCRTASHELGHCLGMDHCVYYACIMQGTASVAEDARQPPYLCPVDDAKIRALIQERGVPGSDSRYVQSMLRFCCAQGPGSAFEPYKVWLEVKLASEGRLIANS